MITQPNRIAALAGLLVCAAATPALAHTGAAPTGSLAAGLLHPVLGPDHLVVMVAVGVWAALRGGGAVLLWPTAFVAVMLGGFALAVAGVALPAVEPVILASVAALGLAAALALRVPAVVGAAVILPFALAHGYAHGAEIGAAGPAGYVAGFVIATAALHAAGIGAARLARGSIARAGLRVATALAAGATVAVGAGL